MQLDTIFARAQLSYAMDAGRPLVRKRGGIDLKRARHPLLDPAKAVPVTVALGGAYDTLVITGPNTGGKTVSLKTLGLLTLMVEPGTPLEAWVREGSFTLLSPLEVLKETELFLQHVDSEGTVFRANHASNYLTLKGTLNGDRKALLAQIAAALDGRRDLKPEFLRAL